VVDIVEVSAVVTAAGVLIGIVYYLLEIRHQTKARNMDLFMRVWLFGSTDEVMGAIEKVNSLQFKDYEDYIAKYGSFLSENPVQRAVWMVIDFYQLLGILVDDNLIDIKTVYHITGGTYPKLLYEKLKSIVLAIRRDTEPYFAADFEYLINELTREEPRIVGMLKKREQQLASKTA